MSRQLRAVQLKTIIGSFHSLTRCGLDRLHIFLIFIITRRKALFITVQIHFSSTKFRQFFPTSAALHNHPWGIEGLRRWVYVHSFISSQ